MRRFYLRERLQPLTSRKRQLERLSTDFYDWCNDSVCTSAWSRVYEHLELLMSQGMQMGLLSSSVERQKRFFAPRLTEKVLTNRKHGLDHAIRFWITHNYVINCPRKSSRFCSFGRNIAFTKFVVSHKRGQMQRVFMWTFFIVVKHTTSPLPIWISHVLLHPAYGFLETFHAHNRCSIYKINNSWNILCQTMGYL